MNRAERPTRAHDEHISPLRLSTYADGETPREERAEIEAHLAACAACSSRLDALRAVGASLAALPRTAPSAGVWDEVQAGARRAGGASSVSRERLGRARGAGPIRLRDVRLPDMAAARPSPPASRRSRWRTPFPAALPTIAALLLVGLTMSLLLRSSIVATDLPPNVTPTATIPVGDTLKVTRQAVDDVASQLRFTPVVPTSLPTGARLEPVQVSMLTSGARCLDITWKFSAGPVRALHLREQPSSAPTDAYTNPTAQTAGLAWRLSDSPPWRAMTHVERPNLSGVEQTRGDVRLMLDALPASDASPSYVAAALRLTSLSMDARYGLPGVAIVGPDTGSLQRSIAIVAEAQGPQWTWDVTLSADNSYRHADIIPMSGGGPTVREITYAGTGVRLDLSNNRYQALHPPTLYPPPPNSVTQIAFDASAYLGTGQLWNLGPTNVHIPGRGTMMVYDLYRVDAVRPEHVYAAIDTGAVVAVFVDTNPNAASPGGPGSSQPFVSTAVCAPYTVTYTWLIYEPPTQSRDFFSTQPPRDSTPGSVPPPFICAG
ncbi:MAG TPA: zf-HC2 domain-containing protein [Ktedonobacterales bacterium]|nr:zf-HC2 domain-containing protein [Ktedonobacterales bacterium]